MCLRADLSLPLHYIISHGSWRCESSPNDYDHQIALTPGKVLDVLNSLYAIAESAIRPAPQTGVMCQM